MDIDLRTFLLVLIVIVGVIFVLLISNYSLFDTSDKNALENTNAIEATIAASNTTKKPKKTTSNITNTSETAINKLMTVTEDENINNEEVSSDEVESGLKEETENLIQSNNNNFKSPFDLSLIEKNNTSPKLIFNENEKYVSRTVSFFYLKPPCTLNYKVPVSWASPKSDGEKDPITGAYLRHNSYSLSQFGEYDENETTYEEFLNDFIEYERQHDTFSNDVEFRTRTLAINGSTNFPILEKVGYYSITNYMVFVYSGNVFSIEITVSNDEDYNDEFLRRIDQIFLSSYINY